jgi:hypothetical protein
MAYPQPNANQYMLKGYPFFRLQTPLISPGDIYESEQGALAFALGPESDVARMTIYYFDDQIPTRLNSVDISQDRMLSGKVFARNDTAYIPSARPGRILMAVDDLYDPSWKPPGFDPDQDGLQFVTPILDVIQYFSSPPNIAPQRADRRYLFQRSPQTNRNSWLVLPYWGRRYMYLSARNPNSIDACTITVLGINYVIVDDSVTAAAEHNHMVTTLLPASALSTDGGQKELVVTAGPPNAGNAVTAIAIGMFDAIAISVNVPETILKIVMSDVEEA